MRLWAMSRLVRRVRERREGGNWPMLLLEILRSRGEGGRRGGGRGERKEKGEKERKGGRKEGSRKKERKKERKKNLSIFAIWQRNQE